MIAYAAATPVDAAPFLDRMSRFSLCGNLVDGWERRAGGNHPDGWGVAYRQGDTTRVVRSGNPANADPLLAGLDVVTDRFIGHVRYASNVATVDAGNSHPFVSRGVVLAHNGTFKGRVGEEADRRGVSDSLVFTELLGAAWEERTLDGLAGALARMLGDRDLVGAYSAANLLIASGSGGPLFALRHCRKDPGYYTLYLRSSPGMDVVASEPDDDAPGWRLLGNGELVEIGGAAARSRRILTSAPGTG